MKDKKDDDDDDEDDDEKKGKEYVKIDFDGLADRVVAPAGRGR